ncbi:MerR family transcriptional regulator [Apilactobacillus timberlakei]|uniref:MerR family transcriptional regulator n=1 Tax=Apilactobacillus timberlakei TaxID=2008380 RepID=UPI001125C182|nr:MerR family transcriptional regulator [Apilactobacillus timberlakei]TPR23259.1 MerR family transcriptional regulator [Apilactobacillus timberlakei]
MNIKKASEVTGVSSSTIRYYEKEHLIPPIKRNKSGVRQIDESSIRRIGFIKQMRAAGMGISVLRKYIYLFDFEKDSKNEQINILKEQVQIMEEKRDDLQSAIDHLYFKISHFDDHMVNVEKELKELEKHDSENNNDKRK